jgi:PIN domain nuclease of toxin-antitoxin system
MNLLLDTHVLLWWLDDHQTLSKKAKAAIAEGKNLVFVSAVVIWEKCHILNCE